MLDKDVLLKPRLAEEDYEIPGVGTVRVRLLSWQECLEFKQLGSQSRESMYRRLLATAMVDPKISEADAELWLGNAPGGELEDLVTHVIRASGLVEGAQKSV